MKSILALTLLVAAAAAEVRNSTFTVYSVPDYDSWSNVRPHYYFDRYDKHYYEYDRYDRYYERDHYYEDYKRMEKRPDYPPEHKYKSYYSPRAHFYHVVGIHNICEQPIVYFYYDAEHHYLAGCVLENGFYEVVENRCSAKFAEHLYAPGDKAGFVFYGGSFNKNEMRDLYVKYIEFPDGVRLSSARRLAGVYHLPFFLVVDVKYFPYFNKEYLKEIGRIEVTDHVKILSRYPAKHD